MQAISRKTAMSLGLKRYFTGQACPKGHVTERILRNSVCVECAVIQTTKKIAAKKAITAAKRAAEIAAEADGLTTRARAKFLGLTHYFTGKVCSHGHIAKRHTKSGSCTICGLMHVKACYAADPEAVLIRRRANYAADLEKSRAACRKSYNKHREKRSTERSGPVRREVARINQRKYAAIQRTTNIQYRIKKSLSATLSAAVRRKQKAGSAIRDLGCPVEFLRLYLELQFAPGMTWDNYGTAWHIDHRDPLRSVDLTDREQLRSVVHYSNLQPLSLADHAAKTRVDVAAMRATRAFNQGAPHV